MNWPTPKNSMSGYRYVHFGFPVCGFLRTLPVGIGESPLIPPYCVAHAGEYSWRPAQDGSWTKMIEVKAAPVHLDDLKKVREGAAG